MTRTLADMTPAERADCVGRWCERRDADLVILAGVEDKAVVVFPESGGWRWDNLPDLTPRYDLPRAWTAEGDPVPLPEPDRDGRWRLAAHYTLHLDATHHDGPVAVIRGKHGPLTTIPVDELKRIGDVMHAAAHVYQKEKP